MDTHRAKGIWCSLSTVDRSLTYMLRYDIIKRMKKVFSETEERRMKQLIVSVVVVVMLLTSGVVMTQSRLGGTAYADGGGD